MEFFILIFLATLILIGIVFLLIRKIFISRLVHLTRTVDELIEKNNLSARIAFKGTDEVSRLAASINKMLDRIEESHTTLKFLSWHDSLTGLYNRTRFDQELRRLEDSEQVVGVILGDIDGLKQINDTQGHGAGDKMLKTGAQILRDIFIDQEIIARIGGDEFAVLISKTDAPKLAEYCARICGRIAEYNADHPNFKLGFSLGYAVSREDPPRLNELLREADAMVYLEKQKHRLKSR